MGYGILRVEKVKASAMGGLEIEANRSESNKKEFKASAIDWDRTPDNRFLVKSNNWKHTADKLIAKYGCKVRKDSTYMIDCLITASGSFFTDNSPEIVDSFFESAVAFARQHFGIVINAVVHNDETTPHIHIACVPIVEKEPGKYALSAKALLGGVNDIRKLQDAAYKELFEPYGLERGETKDEKVKNLKALDYKLQKRAEEVKAAEAEKVEIEQEIGKLEQIRNIIGSIKDIANDLFSRLFSVIKDGLHQLVDKIEHNQAIMTNDLIAADCKMGKCATYTHKDGEIQPLYAPKTNRGDPLSWSGNRPIYALIDNAFIGFLKMDSRHTFTAVESPEWEKDFSSEKRDFNDSICDRDITALEERIDLIDRIVNNDQDPIDNASEDFEPSEEIDYDDIANDQPFDYDNDDDSDDYDPACI